MKNGDEGTGPASDTHMCGGGGNVNLNHKQGFKKNIVQMIQEKLNKHSSSLLEKQTRTTFLDTECKNGQ
jgi:hypothetical protein